MNAAATQIDKVRRVASRAVTRAKGGVASARKRSRSVDHLARAAQRYVEKRGTRLAASVTYYGFFSLFPLLSLAFAVTGYLAAVYPPVRESMLTAMHQFLPGVVGKIDFRAVAEVRAGAGVFGLVGLLIAGATWIGALREALRVIWRKPPRPRANMVTRKIIDLAVLLLLGGFLLASVTVSGFATSAARTVLGAVGLYGSLAARVVLSLLAVGLALLTDVVVFLVVFIRLPDGDERWRHLLPGAVLAAVGFEALSLAVTYYLGVVTRNPIYGTFAATIGLLAWMNLAARFTLLAAAWTVTRR